MAVEFLTDEQAARYGSFHEVPSRAELERYFFLDDADREAVQAKRRAHNRLGFAVQLSSVRFLGRFMPDPRQVPAEVAEYLAGQLEIEDVSCLKLYGERDGTARTHAGEIQEAGGWRDFAEVREELVGWLDARAWTTGDGPKALFDAAAGWLRESRVLLPGASRLARLVGTVREAANQRLWDTLYGMMSTGQRAVLDSLLTVPPGERVSELDRLRRGPVRVSGPQMKRALERAEEIAALGMGAVDVSGTAAASGGVVALWGGRQGVAAAPALRRPQTGDVVGHHGLPHVAGGGRCAGSVGGSDRIEAAGQG